MYFGISEAEKAQNSLKYERRPEQMYDNRKHNYDNWNLTLSFYVVLRLLGSLIFSWKRADDLMLRFKKTNFGWSLRKTNNNPVISTPVAGDFASWWLTRTASILNWTTQHYSPEKWLHNRIYCPSNRSKQIKETHTAYSTGTQYTRQSLNEKQHTWFYKR